MISDIITKTNKWILLILIGLSIILSFYGVYYLLTNDNDIIFQIGASLFIISGLLFVLKYSKLIYENRHIRIIYFLIGVMLIALMMKIQHYPGFKMLFILCSIGFIITYTHRFIKKTKDLVDLLKYAWVLVNYISMILMYLSIDFGYYLSALGLFVFGWLLTVFLIKNKFMIFNNNNLH